MKRMTALFLTAGLIGSASSAGADHFPASTVPSIPAPVLRGETLAPMAPAAGLTPVTVHPRNGIDRLLPMPRLFSTSAPVAKSDAPVVNAAPIAMPAYPISPTTVTMPGACGTSGCESGKSHSGECWQKFKSWLCHSPSKVRLGLTPTPYHTPYVMQFDCASRPACSSGICAQNCGPRVGNGNVPCRGTAGGCLGVAVNNDPGIAGYRFAVPENKAVTSPVTQPVVSASYKPTAMVPYQLPAGTTRP